MKRILFVDDEPDMLNGLKRMLRARRGTWTMVFVASAEEALSAMSVDPFDVVVTDMKMPGMNGVELLEQVRILHPRTGRIVFSGHVEMDASMRSVSVSHEVLAKPCDPEIMLRVRGSLDSAGKAMFGLPISTDPKWGLLTFMMQGTTATSAGWDMTNEMIVGQR